MLDTNIVSDLLRHPGGRVFDGIRRVGEPAVLLNIVTAAELRYGAARRHSPSLTQTIEGLLARIPVEPFDAPADRRYGEIRSFLQREGRPIGPNDLLIAAHALALDSILVTNNVREFTRVPGLAVEDWLA